MVRLKAGQLAFIVSALASNAEIIGDFAPLEPGNRGTYHGYVSQVLSTGISGPTGIKTRQTDSIVRTVEVVAEKQSQDTSWFEVRQIDSVTVRISTYKFSISGPDGTYRIWTEDSVEQINSIAIVHDTVLVVGDEIMLDGVLANCRCEPYKFSDILFNRRLYPDSMIIDTSYMAENRKSVLGDFASPASSGYRLQWMKIKDIGLVKYGYSSWSSNGTGRSEQFGMVKFESENLSIAVKRHDPMIRAATTGRRLSGLNSFLHANHVYDLSGRRISVSGK